MIKLGSLFAGIGGFELGAQWAFDRAGIPHKVLFQVEQNKYCQSILRKHWPDAEIFDDVCVVGRHNLPDIDILMGGFPCQDISVAGHQKGIINGEKSSLWFEMLRVISELRPRIAVLENVPAVVRVGGPTVVGGLAEIGYDCEWQIISAKQFGAPHLRKRWFCVATDTNYRSTPTKIQAGWSKHSLCNTGAEKNATNTNRIGPGQARHRWFAQDDCDGSQIQQRRFSQPTNTSGAYVQRGCMSSGVQAKNTKSGVSIHTKREISRRWEKFPSQSPLRRRDDGISNRLARLRALGNAIVPQCSEYIFQHIIKNIIQNS